MKFGILAAGVAAVAVMVGAPASAAVLFGFDPGAASPEPGYHVVNAFDVATGITGSNFQIKVPPSDGNGALPANSIPAGTPYLSVLGGGFANVSLGGLFSAFQFDWGSIDTYNTLTIHGTAGDVVVVPGGNFPNQADGNQFAAGTNGVFTVVGTAGEKFTGITLASGSNSFEIDNLAVAGGVPEPAAWTMMILGFAAAGSLIRRRRAMAATV
ncbi:PEPxxWA-CTERM sorting domain-containing protein [Phenylobacterium sp.]|uniref:Npun_F0296 family exosortase-dependent surface protein n=1 Tax=Phenylobacterium sp. TaxID=1871053 RepID=UPI0025CBC11A|nr:PEPxxWA-CTERM sorting domain-containing protein [Phenylobacterium sp.]